jgi:hypothetical protein
MLAIFKFITGVCITVYIFRFKKGLCGRVDRCLSVTTVTCTKSIASSATVASLLHHPLSSRQMIPIRGLCVLALTQKPETLLWIT